ncbi:hypothetical protein C2S52_017902 [Perilla frutescens var. hirtella]|nr:hypothetical protein C2S52_017902 [Perilla frutescens var. hirtella]
MGFPLLRRVLQKRSAGSSQILAASCCNSGSCYGGRRMMSSVNNSCSSDEARGSPLLMLPSLSDERVNLVYNFHSLANNKETSHNYKRIGGNGIESDELPSPTEVEFVGSSHGWLALYNRVSNNLFLSNPITSRHIKLPALHTLPDPEVNSKGGVSRVALSCSPDDEGCRVMITVGRAKRLAFCMAGRSREWTPIGDLYCERELWDEAILTESRETARREYEDVVYSGRHKLFFCITRFATELEGWNVEDPLFPRIDWSLQHNDELKFDSHNFSWPSQSELKSQCWHLKYLVSAVRSDDLFLVVRHVNPRIRNSYSYSDVAEWIYYSKYRGCDYSYPYKTVDFDVYKIKINGGKLSYMDASLDGLAMFVGINQSYSMSASEFPELKPNTIYFADENRLMRLSRSFLHNEYGGHDNGIFNYETKTFSSCCANCPLNPLDYDNIERIDPPPLWFTPP